MKAPLSLPVKDNATTEEKYYKDHGTSVVQFLRENRPQVFLNLTQLRDRLQEEELQAARVEL